MKMVLCVLTLHLLILNVMAQPFQPPLFATWHYQVNNDVFGISTALNKDIYVFDMWTIDPTTISSVQSKPAKVFCTFSAGIWENWRSDANDFPTVSHSGQVPGTNNQEYLDISDKSTFETIILARMDMAKNKGCDGVVF